MALLVAFFATRVGPLTPRTAPLKPKNGLNEPPTRNSSSGPPARHFALEWAMSRLSPNYHDLILLTLNTQNSDFRLRHHPALVYVYASPLLYVLPLYVSWLLLLSFPLLCAYALGLLSLHYDGGHISAWL